jgi:hypothetical protein
MFVKHCSTFVLTFVQKENKNTDLFLQNIHTYLYISIESRVFDPKRLRRFAHSIL